MTTPRYLHFQLTERCNLSCPGCYLPERCGKGAPVQKIEETVFRPLAEAGVRFATLTGGEPLLHPEWLGICKAAVRHFDSVQLVCNGMLLDLTAYEALRDAGIKAVKVSLDGPTAAVHDALRGKVGCFDTVTANLRAIGDLSPQRRGEINLGCICTVHETNVQYLHETAMLVSDMNLDSMLFQPFHPFGVLYPPQDQLIKTPQANEHFLNTLKEQRRRLQDLRISRPGFLDNSLAMLDRFVDFYICAEGPEQVCGANRFIFVDSLFNVRGCLFSSPLSTLNQQSITDFRQSTQWAAFDSFRSNCKRCLMGCQFVEKSQDLTEEGFAQLSVDNFEKAEDSFNDALNIEYSVPAEHGKGLALLHLGDAEKALKHLKQALACRPRDYFILADVGRALLQLHAWDELKGVIDRIFTLSNDDPFGHYLFGLLSRERGDRQTARTSLCIMLDSGLSQNDPWPPFNYGLVCLELGILDEAVRGISIAIMRDPHFPWFRFRLAQALYRQGKHALAINECKEAIRLDSAPAQFSALLEEITHSPKL